MTNIDAALAELRDRGLGRRLRPICGPQGPQITSMGSRSCCFAQMTTSG